MSVATFDPGAGNSEFGQNSVIKSTINMQNLENEMMSFTDRYEQMPPGDYNTSHKNIKSIYN